MTMMQKTLTQSARGGVLGTAILAAVALLPTPSLQAQPPNPLGGSFSVNSTTALSQTDPEIATDFDGEFIAVWISAGQDGSGTGIYAQLFDELGDPDGPEIRVNDTTAGDQTDPAVSMNDDEGFAVAWVGPDADGTGIFLRVYDEDHLATTLTDIAVNATTTGIQANPDVAIAEDGQVFVVWESPDTSGSGVFGRFFASNGVPLSVEFEIPTSNTGDQKSPVVADVDEDGSFVVAWEGVDAQGTGIFAQRVQDTGTFLGTEIPVNTVTTGDQTQPMIGVRTNDDVLEDNGFVIVWQGPDSDGSGIFARYFEEDGTPAGPQIQVNPEATADQTDPDVSIDDEGDFVVTWTDHNPMPALTLEGVRPKGSPILIRGRRITRDTFVSNRGGSTIAILPKGAVSETFTVVSGAISSSAVAAEGNGDFVVLWQDAFDGSGTGIFGQRFGLKLVFGEGFESGGLTNWNRQVP